MGDGSIHHPLGWMANISPALVREGAHSAELGGCYWLRRTVLEFISARYVALVPVAVITMTTSWHGVRCLLCAVHGDVTLSLWLESQEATTTYQ